MVVRLSAITLLVFLGLGLYTWRHYSAAAAVYSSDTMAAIELPHRLRTSAEHDAARTRNGGNPFILQIEPADRGAILYFGGSHTRDPNHPQIADITERWRAFQPTVALCEGRSRGYFYGMLIEPFAGLAEPALVHQLARRDGVRLLSLEPAYEAEVAALIARYQPEQVALYFFLRVYVAEAGGVANDPLALDLFTKRTDVAGLRGVLSTPADVDRIWKRDFPQLTNWRTLTAEPSHGYLAEISADSRRIRGEHMLRTIVDLARKGERVFAVVGSGHVIRQEWNLRALFGMPPAWDQPARPP